MAKNIEFTLYNRERDIESVVSLLKRNKFYIGALDRDLTVEKYLKYQSRRGFQFAVVARIGNEVIGHIGAYINGNQEVFTEHQIYLGSAVVDAKYQRVMPSIGELYMFAMNEVIKRNYRVAICDALMTNTNSLYMIKRLGGVLTNGKPNMYNNYLLHIYTPAVFQTLGVKSLYEGIEKFGQLYDATPKLDKKRIREQVELIEGKYIKYVFNVKEGEFQFYINSKKINMGKVIVTDYASLELLENDSVISIVAQQDLGGRISFYAENEIEREEQVKLAKDKKLEFKVNENVTRIHVEFNELTATFDLFPCQEEQKENEYLPLGRKDLLFDKQTGNLRFFDGDKPLFVEMWTCLTRPILIGYLVPKRVTLDIEQLENNKYKITEQKKEYSIHREYTLEENRVIIRSYADVIERTIIEPIFSIALDDLDYECTIITEDATVQKKYNAKRDKKFCYEELIHEYIGKESYVESPVKEVHLTFGDKKYRVTTEDKMYCFQQFNYVGFKFVKPSEFLNEDVIKENALVELGTIVIERYK